ncbi:MAG: hypothetical protein JJT88_12335 [Gammaproteobacteria bacterium]|nr:hypothetical protein [Gammaproteobacteria bacterium]
MPNTFAYVVLFSWPIVVMVLFRKLPIPQALAWSIVGGFLLLPTRAALNLPMVPALDKNTVPVIMAALMCVIYAQSAAVAPGARLGAMARSAPGDSPPQAGSPVAPGFQKRSWGDTLILLLVVVMLVAPFLTFLQNREPVFAGPIVLPGLRLYDALSSSGNTLLTILPFLLARRFLATAVNHRVLLIVITIAAIAYAFLVLWEWRMSPRLNIWVYGFFPHSWVQHIRGGGFRPVVFLEHGLAVGLFLASAVVAACSLWRMRVKDDRLGFLWPWAAAWIAIALLLSRNVGAAMLMVLVAPLALVATRRIGVALAAIVAIIVLLYPMLRSNGWVPIQTIVDVSTWVSEERVGSLVFRMENEELLLDRASEKPIAGWGGYSRGRVHHEETGRDLAITDGLWIIRKSSAGWVGYIAMFGLLTLPIVLLWRVSRKKEIEMSTVGLMLIMAVALLYTIPNAFLGPVYWLMAGALAGHYRLLAAQVVDNPGRSNSTVRLQDSMSLPSSLGQR